MKTLFSRRWLWLFGAWLGALSLIWVPVSPFWRVVGTLFVAVALPGWLAFEVLFVGERIPWPEAVFLAGGLGYAAFLLGGGVLHILPGPISRLSVVGIFGLLAAVLGAFRARRGPGSVQKQIPKGALWGVVFVFVVAAAFRLPNLGYAEFQ